MDDLYDEEQIARGRELEEERLDELVECWDDDGSYYNHFHPETIEPEPC